MLAIVLRRRDFRENDQIISLYTLDKGKMEVLAKGVKKITSKNSASLEPFFLVEAEIIKGRELDRLASVQAIKSFKKIRFNIQKSSMAGYASGLVDYLLSEGEKEIKIFEMFKSWLNYLNELDKPAQTLIINFIVKLLAGLGFVPVLNKCAICNKKLFSADKNNQKLFFNPAAGGIMCSSCVNLKREANEYILTLPAEDLKDWEKLSTSDWLKIPAKISRDLRKAIYVFAEYHSERKIEKWPGTIL